MTTAVLSYTTSIDVSAEARAALVPLLNRRLADMVDLFNQTKHAARPLCGQKLAVAR